MGHSLKTLAEEARIENTTMRRLTEKATADAAAVKVLTIMTLVYLPATVVSVSKPSLVVRIRAYTCQNFFSTSFVHQVTRPDNSVRLTVTSNWWIFLAASLPLTIVTLYVWWFYVQKQVTGLYPGWWRLTTTYASQYAGHLIPRLWTQRPVETKPAIPEIIQG
jgi:hypothetical protein